MHCLLQVPSMGPGCRGICHDRPVRSLNAPRCPKNCQHAERMPYGTLRWSAAYKVTGRLNEHTRSHTYTPRPQGIDVPNPLRNAAPEGRGKEVHEGPFPIQVSFHMVPTGPCTSPTETAPPAQPGDPMETARKSLKGLSGATPVRDSIGSAESGANSIDSGPNSANVGRCWTKFCQDRAQSGKNRPNVGRFRAEIGRSRP